MKEAESNVEPTSIDEEMIQRMKDVAMKDIDGNMSHSMNEFNDKSYLGHLKHERMRVQNPMKVRTDKEKAKAKAKKKAAKKSKKKNR